MRRIFASKLAFDSVSCNYLLISSHSSQLGLIKQLLNVSKLKIQKAKLDIFPTENRKAQHIVLRSGEINRINVDGLFF